MNKFSSSGRVIHACWMSHMKLHTASYNRQCCCSNHHANGAPGTSDSLATNGAIQICFVLYCIVLYCTKLLADQFDDSIQFSHNNIHSSVTLAVEGTGGTCCVATTSRRAVPHMSTPVGIDLVVDDGCWSGVACRCSLTSTY